MIAGFITAISTYAVQNMTYVNPLRGSMSASTLRSSHWNRSNKAHVVLEDRVKGRNRILVVQLQGHLFFGNMAQLTENMKRLLTEKRGSDAQPLIVIMDFGLVLGIDSSAAQAIAKLKNVMQKQYDVELCIFVTGSSNGFPTDYDLTKELQASSIARDTTVTDVETPDEMTGLLNPPQVGIRTKHFGSHVCDTLDLALCFSENALISWVDPCLVDGDLSANENLAEQKTLSLSEEKELALRYLVNLCPPHSDKRLVEQLFTSFERETYNKGEFVWKQGTSSNSAKLLVQGMLIALLENEAGTSETVASGNTIGELGLVEGVPRMSSVQAISERAILYSLSREAFEELGRDSPEAARLVDLICVRYLSARVQHVSNRIFETRCLPI